MNTATPSTIQSAQEVINGAFQELCARIKTGKLRASYKNGGLLVMRIKEANPELFVSGQLPTVRQLADAFCTAIQKDVDFALSLDWERLPAQLAKRFEKQGKDTPYQTQQEVTNLGKKMAEANKADARIREQEQARKRCLNLIERFTPTSKGRVVFTMQSKWQSEWRQEFAKTKDFVALEKTLIAAQEKVYAELERPTYSGGN